MPAMAIAMAMAMTREGSGAWTVHALPPGAPFGLSHVAYRMSHRPLADRPAVPAVARASSMASAQLLPR